MIQKQRRPQSLFNEENQIQKYNEQIIESQPDFFNGDFSVLKPMKLKDIADKLNMDISTISRSTKYDGYAC